MNCNTKQFWEKVEQDFKFRPLDYLCLSSETFQSEWMKDELGIVSLAFQFLRNSEWNQFFEARLRSEGVLFHIKDTGSWKENWRKNVRMDFIKWNINRLSN